MRLLTVLSLGLITALVWGGAARAQYAHAPYEMQECSVCHETGDQDDPGPLTGEVNELCFQCHDGLGEAVGSLANVHPVLEDGCTTCHDPHESAQPKLLIMPLLGLCGECHDVAETAQDAPVQHGPVISGDACLNCHDPHATSHGSLLKAGPFETCLRCHGQDGLQDGSGRSLTNFKTLLETSAMVHSPVEDEDCLGCHEVHGGKNFRLLTGAYPADFYAPFAAENYELCFTCHEQGVFEAPTTTRLTGFRDGDRNLHYVHVNKAVRGRTCRACHEPHAAPHEHMLRDGVPYGAGGWVLKVNWTAAPNGGSCAKTCHPTKPYDRLAGTD